MFENDLSVVELSAKQECEITYNSDEDDTRNPWKEKTIDNLFWTTLKT
jgi:hypothetical protein